MPLPTTVDPNTAAFAAAARRPLPVLSAAGVVGGLAGLPNAEPLRQAAADIRQHALGHLDRYVCKASEQLVAAGATVAEAVDAADARRLIAALARDGAGRLATWSRVGEEVGLGTEPGRRDPTFPGSAPLIVAGSFVVAETGRVVVIADDVTVAAAVAGAATVVCVVGVDAVVPRAVDLVVLLKVLGRSATGRAMPPVVSLVGGRPGMHVVWVDHGRRAAAAGPYREALRCIGCGACSAVCPVYQPAWVSPASGGPIGAILGPVLGRPADPQLPFASTLCGACGDVCPVKIDLPGLLVRLRADAVTAGTVRHRRLRIWAWLAASPRRFRAGAWWTRRRSPSVTTVPSFADLWAARQ